MSKIKKLLHIDFNPKNKKHRENLFMRSFMKHDIQSRLFTLQNESINLTAQTLSFALNPDKRSAQKLAEAIGNVEMMIEVIQLSTPRLKEASDSSKRTNLENLFTNTVKSEQKQKDQPNPKHNKLTESTLKATKAFDSFASSIPRKKGFFNFFKYIGDYFSK